MQIDPGLNPKPAMDGSVQLLDKVVQLDGRDRALHLVLQRNVRLLLCVDGSVGQDGRRAPGKAKRG